MTGGWPRPDMRAADNPWQRHWEVCKTDPCALGCQELPSPAIYARAAVLAAEAAADYRKRVGCEVEAARAERAAWQLAEGGAYGHAASTLVAPPRVQGGLTWEQARAIRARYTGTHGEQARLAREYGVSGATICRLLKGQLWAETEEAARGTEKPAEGGAERASPSARTGG